MKYRNCITAIVALLILGGCTIEPLLHLRRVASTKVVMQTTITAELLWQINWQAKWDFVWNVTAYGPLGYSYPKGIRMHIYTLNDEGEAKSHNVYNFSGLEGQADVFVGIHDLLFHNNDSEVLLFKADNDLADINAYTRVISTGLKSSTLVQTVAQKAAATKADDEEIDENVCFMPDELFRLYDSKHHITDNLDDYDFEDGKYILRIKGDLQPATFIYLFQVKLLNNLDRVAGSMGGAALSGVADAVNLNTGVTSDTPVCVPMDVYLNNDDPDILGARCLTFGIPGCNPYDAASVAAAPAGKHWFVLNVTFKTGKYKNIRIDVTDQIRALPTGGVIPLEIDVADFPPEDTDPPIDEGGGGGFKPLIGDWNEETGSATIIN